MRRLATLFATAAVLTGVGCTSNPADQLSRGLAGAVAGIDSWLGASDLPANHLATLRAVHEPGTWRLRTDVDGALDQARGALRDLRESDFASWRDAAIVTQLVSSCATDHDASLMRIEALDTLARIAPWTFSAEVPVDVPLTPDQLIDALKTTDAAKGRTDDDPAFTAEILYAVHVLGAYRFEDDVVPPAAALGVAARRYSSSGRSVRATLGRLTGPALDGFQADPEIHEATDRAYVSLDATLIRGTLLAAVTGDPTDAVRVDAAQQIGRLAFAGGDRELARSLRSDLSSSVRRAAATALGAYPADVAVPALIEGLYDDMSDVRGAVSRALAACTGQSFGTDRGAWKRWWAGHGAARATPGGESAQ